MCEMSFIKLGFGLIMGAGALLSQCCVFGCTTFSAIYLYDKSILFIDQGLYGTNTVSAAVRFNYGANIHYQAGANGPGKPTIMGATYALNGYQWSDFPRDLRDDGGTATLGAGGTVTVTSKYMPADAVLTWSVDTYAGDATGFLSSPSALRGNVGEVNANFVLQSTADADRTVLRWHWFSPARPSGGVFAHSS